MSHLGIDIGSTGTKAIAFDPEGRQLAAAYREYSEVYPGPNLIELPGQIFFHRPEHGQVPFVIRG